MFHHPRRSRATVLVGAQKKPASLGGTLVAMALGAARGGMAESDGGWLSGVAADHLDAPPKSRERFEKLPVARVVSRRAWCMGLLERVRF